MNKKIEEITYQKPVEETKKHTMSSWVITMFLFVLITLGFIENNITYITTVIKISIIILFHDLIGWRLFKFYIKISKSIFSLCLMLTLTLFNLMLYLDISEALYLGDTVSISQIIGLFLLSVFMFFFIYLLIKKTGLESFKESARK